MSNVGTGTGTGATLTYGPYRVASDSRMFMSVKVHLPDGTAAPLVYFGLAAQDPTSSAWVMLHKFEYDQATIPTCSVKQEGAAAKDLLPYVRPTSGDTYSITATATGVQMRINGVVVSSVSTPLTANSQVRFQAFARMTGWGFSDMFLGVEPPTPLPAGTLTLTGKKNPHWSLWISLVVFAVGAAGIGAVIMRKARAKGTSGTK